MALRRCSSGVQSTRFIPGVSLVQIQPPLPSGALEKRLTHQPFTLAFMGSNPIRVTIHVESESVSNEMDSDFSCLWHLRQKTDAGVPDSPVLTARIGHPR